MHDVTKEFEDLDIGITDGFASMWGVESILAPRQVRQVVSYVFESIREPFSNLFMICTCLGQLKISLLFSH